MAFRKRSARLLALAALALPAVAKPEITRELTPQKHWPVGEWLTVTVAAKGDGPLAYQWYKGPAEQMKRTDKSPFRLNDQTSDTLAMECLAHAGGDYWVEVTDTADHTSVLEGPMCLVPCYRVDDRVEIVGLWHEGKTAQVPVEVFNTFNRQWQAALTARPVGAGVQGSLLVHPGSRLPVGKAVGSKPATRTETKAATPSVPVFPMFMDGDDAMPDLLDLDDLVGPH